MNRGEELRSTRPSIGESVVTDIQYDWKPTTLSPVCHIIMSRNYRHAHSERLGNGGAFLVQSY
jgi:hypothetical protein